MYQIMTATGCFVGHHIWEWTGNTTSTDTRPADWQRCKCGRYTYGEFDRLARQAEWGEEPPVASSRSKGK